MVLALLTLVAIVAFERQPKAILAINLVLSVKEKTS
jgi:hypothetical protein